MSSWDSELRQQKSIIQRNLAQIIIAARSAAMSRAHVGLQQQRVRIGFQRAHLGHIFSRLPVHHLAIVQSRLQQNRWISLAFQVGIGTIRLHAEIIFRNLRIAPLLVFSNGQWQRRIEHGVQDVDKGHVADNHAKEIWAHIRYRAHQESARAATLDRQFVRRRIALCDQVFSRGDEVRERVAFLLHAPGVVPRLAKLSAAAKVRHGIAHAAVQQAKPVRTEINRHGDSVAAITVEKKRRRAIARRIAAVDDGKRYAGTVGRSDMQTLADVLRWIVASKNWLLLSQTPVTRLNVVIKNGARSYERFVLEPQMGSVELRIFTNRSIVGRLGKFNAMRRRERAGSIRGQIHDAKIGKAALAFEQYQVALENLRRCNHDLRAIGNNLAPEFSARIAHRDRYKSKSTPARIRANVKHAFIYIWRHPRMFRSKRTAMFRAQRTRMF